ncbi:MAG: hypothetical protein AAF479_15135 [Pseudomonadota bacterium]
MSVSKAVLGDPLTWGAIGVSAVVMAVIAMRFPLAGAELLMLGALTFVHVAAWFALAGATGRYRRRWDERQLEQTREQLEKSQQRVDSLRLAFTRAQFEDGAERLQKLVDGYGGFRRAIGHWHAGTQEGQRKLSKIAGECYDRGLVQLESLSGLVRTLQHTGGDVADNPDAKRMIATSDMLTEGLVAISLSFSDGSRDGEVRIEAELTKLLDRLEESGSVPANQRLE